MTAPEPQPAAALDPSALLADATQRIAQADLIVAEEMTDPKNVDPEGLLLYKLGSAFVLAKVAEGLLAARDDERRTEVRTLTGEELDFYADQHGTHLAEAADQPRYVPQPMQGVRFEAVLQGHYVGRIADREWLYTDSGRFVDISTAEEVGGYRLTGRIVSATPDEIMGVTDGGTSITLPRALITEGPDA